jgi:hypothetical protein
MAEAAPTTASTTVAVAESREVAAIDAATDAAMAGDAVSAEVEALAAVDENAPVDVPARAEVAEAEAMTLWTVPPPVVTIGFPMCGRMGKPRPNRGIVCPPGRG